MAPGSGETTIYSSRPTQPGIDVCANPGGVRPLSVLVVDDNRDAADSLAELVALCGHRARAAHGGAEAITAASADPPDVVLLDLAMPRVDGFEVARRLRAQTVGAVLIALTSQATEAVEQRYTAAGFHLLLIKPVDPPALVDLLRRIGEELDRPRGSNKCG